MGCKYIVNVVSYLHFNLCQTHSAFLREFLTCTCTNTEQSVSLCLHIERSGHIVFGLSICMSVCKNFNIGYTFWMVSNRAFIFHMFGVPCDNPHLLVPYFFTSWPWTFTLTMMAFNDHIIHVDRFNGLKIDTVTMILWFSCTSVITCRQFEWFCDLAVEVLLHVSLNDFVILTLWFLILTLWFWHHDVILTLWFCDFDTMMWFWHYNFVI
jgi:hypothetical protein